jgi:Fe-S-cluster-containing hydrogenase component 2
MQLLPLLLPVAVYAGYKPANCQQGNQDARNECGGDCGPAYFIGKISLDDGRSVIAEGCVGCGHCVEVCPNHAIELSIRDSLYVDKSVERLVRVVEVE